MKTALIFPGQGSQNIGMGHDFYSNFQSSRDIYDQLDKILGESLTNLIFKGEESELAMTENSQPSIMATSVAIIAALIESGKIDEHSFHCVAGHSLGEYSALVANKSLDFKDSVELLKIRSKAMQECMPKQYEELVRICTQLEEHFKDMHDIEFGTTDVRKKRTKKHK